MKLRTICLLDFWHIQMPRHDPGNDFSCRCQWRVNHYSRSYQIWRSTYNARFLGTIKGSEKVPRNLSSPHSSQIANHRPTFYLVLCQSGAERTPGYVRGWLRSPFPSNSPSLLRSRQSSHHIATWHLSRAFLQHYMTFFIIEFDFFDDNFRACDPQDTLQQEYFLEDFKYPSRPEEVQ